MITDLGKKLINTKVITLKLEPGVEQTIKTEGWVTDRIQLSASDGRSGFLTIEEAPGTLEEQIVRRMQGQDLGICFFNIQSNPGQLHTNLHLNGFKAKEIVLRWTGKGAAFVSMVVMEEQNDIPKATT